MSFLEKAKWELKALGIAMLYFGAWFAALLVIKSLVLAEYHIEFRHYSMAFLGALVLAKVVLVLEHVSLGSWIRSQPAWVDVVLRTALYALGVLAVMAVEKGIEGRHHDGGFAEAVKAAIQGADSYHLWVNAICVSGALLVYNSLSVIRAHLGQGGLLALYVSRPPQREALKSPHGNGTLILLGLGLLTLTGCHSIGPRTVTRDRFDYSGALAESWKEQMLLNLVKTRYLDLPIYLDVGQIVSGYTLETSGSLAGSLTETTAVGGNTAAAGASVRFTDRPTITYTPLTGDKFLQGFLTPIDPAKVFALIQAGYAADFILGLSVDSLNGLRNHAVSLGSKRTADPEFFRVLTLLRDIQDAGAVGMRIERSTNPRPATVLFFRDDRVEPAVQQQIDEVRNLLGVGPGQNLFHLVRSPFRGDPGELAVNTRSLYQLLISLALGVEIPQSHRDRQLAPPLATPSLDDSTFVRIHSGPKKPGDAFVAVSYEGEWFWIANNDWKSKRTFSSILFLFTLADTGGTERLPMLTIPTQ